MTDHTYPPLLTGNKKQKEKRKRKKQRKRKDKELSFITIVINESIIYLYIVIYIIIYNSKNYYLTFHTIYGILYTNKTLYRKVVNILIYKQKEDSIQLGIQSINLTQVINELINWRNDCNKYKDTWCDPVRIAMIDSFEDIILNAIEENECLNMV